MYFGTAIDISGRTLAVTARYEDDPVSNAGVLYIIDKGANGVWAHKQTIAHAGAGTNAYIGYGVSIDRDLLIVGGQGDDAAVADAGAAYIYARSQAGTWVEVTKLQHMNATAGDEFGYSVGVNGGYAVIGIPSLHFGGTSDTGAISLVKVRDEAIQFLHTDHLGSPVAATDVFGSVVGTAAYYPFGEQRTGTGLFDTDRGFTGQIADAATGLNFYNARYQDPVLGRFVSPDSIIPDPFTATAYNRFAYVTNSPLVYTDPSGNCPWCIVGAAVGGAVIGGGINVWNQLQETRDRGWVWSEVGIAEAGRAASVGAGVGATVAVGGLGAAALGAGPFVTAGFTASTAAAAATGAVYIESIQSGDGLPDPIEALEAGVAAASEDLTGNPFLWPMLEAVFGSPSDGGADRKSSTERAPRAILDFGAQSTDDHGGGVPSTMATSSASRIPGSTSYPTVRLPAYLFSGEDEYR